MAVKIQVRKSNKFQPLLPIKSAPFLFSITFKYPGVAKGIENDISNLLALLSVAGVLPEGKFINEQLCPTNFFSANISGLFVDTLIHHMKIELAQECDYIREAKCCRKMKEILSPFPELHVPSVVDAIATKQVFATEMLEGLNTCLLNLYRIP